MEPGEGPGWDLSLLHSWPFTVKTPMHRVQRAELPQLRQMQKNQEKGEMDLAAQPQSPGFKSALYHLLYIWSWASCFSFLSPIFPSEKGHNNSLPAGVINY